MYPFCGKCTCRSFFVLSKHYLYACLDIGLFLINLSIVNSGILGMSLGDDGSLRVLFGGLEGVVWEFLE